MSGYGWDEFDPRTGGKQTIHDEENQLDIATQFVKIPGGQHGGSWGARINGALREGAPKGAISSVVFYIGFEGLGTLQVTNPYDKRGYKGPINMKGSTQDLGEFDFTVTDNARMNKHPEIEHPEYEKKPLDRTFVKSVMAQEEALWQAKRMFPLIITIPKTLC